MAADDVSILDRWTWAMLVPLPGKGTKRTLQRAVLMTLAKHATDLTCWVGQPRLQEITGAGRTALHFALSELEAAGLIERRPRWGRNSHSGRVMREADLTILRIAENPLAIRSRDEHSGDERSPNLNSRPPREPKTRQTRTVRGDLKEGNERGALPRDALKKVFDQLPDESRTESSLGQFSAALAQLDPMPSLDDLEQAAKAYRADPPKRVKPAHFWISDEAFHVYLPGSRNEREIWQLRARGWRESGYWLEQWGPRPREPGFLGPKDIFNQEYLPAWLG